MPSTIAAYVRLPPPANFHFQSVVTVLVMNGGETAGNFTVSLVCPTVSSQPVPAQRVEASDSRNISLLVTAQAYPPCLYLYACQDTETRRELISLISLRSVRYLCPSTESSAGATKARPLQSRYPFRFRTTCACLLLQTRISSFPRSIGRYALADDAIVFSLLLL